MTPRPHVAALAPYALADLSVPDGLDPVSLAQNESAWPPSPDALQAARQAVNQARLYPDPDWSDLRAAISAVHDIDPDTILIGAGSMELIVALVAAYAGPGDTVLSTTHAYALFKGAAAMAGARYTAAPETDLTVSVDALLGAVTPQTRLVCVANPANPTGTRIGQADLARLRAGLPPDTLLLIDEAYGEFTDTAPTFHMTEAGNTVVLRTFSKAYALAGLRIGWGVFPPAVAEQVRKLLNPNNVSGPAQAAAAAAMRDQAHMHDLVRRTSAIRARFCRGLDGLGLTHVPSHTNFVLIRFADAQAAGSADAFLRQSGILMRGMGGYGLPECLRATISTEPAMDAALSGLADWRSTQETDP